VSGHSKWATIKRKKGAADAKRSNMFAKLLRAVEVAAREGGPSVDGNMTLASAVEKARSFSVPIDNIERAIKRGTGELEGVTYETLTYEGYAPGGVAVLVDVLTDNRNRAAADVRRIFTKYGSNLAEPGAVSWMFTKRGIVLVPKASVSEDDLLALALQEGAEDLYDQEDLWQVTSTPRDVLRVRAAIEAGGVPMESAQITMEPSTTVELDRSGAGPVLKLLDALEELDDVQEVHSNFDLPDDVMAELAAG